MQYGILKRMQNLFDLTGKVTIVTGSGRGLGRAIAKGMADAGASVVVCSRTLSEAQDTAAEISDAGGISLALQADTGKRASCEQLIADTVAHFGKLDVLVNNAGIDIIEPAEDASEEAWDEILNINLKGYSAVRNSPHARCSSREPAARLPTTPPLPLASASPVSLRTPRPRAA